MAVTTLTETQSYGVEFNTTTADSADWGSVANDTVFFDFDTRLVYYKNSLGSVTRLFDNGGSGLVGIPDSNGTFVYSNDIKTAIESASAGDTVFLFGDCETTSTIAIPTGVNIQGNNFEIFNVQNDATKIFETSNVTGYKGRWSNLRLRRRSTVANNTVLGNTVGGGVTSVELDCDNVTIDTDSFGLYVPNTAADSYVRGIEVITTSSLGAIDVRCNLYDSYAFSTTGPAIYAPQPNRVVKNCVGKSVSSLGLSTGTYVNCLGITSTGSVSQGGSFYNCVIISTSGILCETGNWYNTTGQTTSTTYAHGGAVRSSAVYQNGSGAGHETFGNSGPIENSWIISIGGIGVNKTNSGAPVFIRNSFIRSAWNNAGGHAVVCGTGGDVVNCFLQVQNASAYGITGASSSYSGNKVINATTKYNVTTQLDTSNKDNQGNS